MDSAALRSTFVGKSFEATVDVNPSAIAAGAGTLQPSEIAEREDAAAGVPMNGAPLQLRVQDSQKSGDVVKYASHRMSGRAKGDCRRLRKDAIQARHCARFRMDEFSSFHGTCLIGQKVKMV